MMASPPWLFPAFVLLFGLMVPDFVGYGLEYTAVMLVSSAV